VQEGDGEVAVCVVEGVLVGDEEAGGSDVEGGVGHGGDGVRIVDCGMWYVDCGVRWICGITWSVSCMRWAAAVVG
jgi:hypothetical protein